MGRENKLVPGTIPSRALCNDHVRLIYAMHSTDSDHAQLDGNTSNDAGSRRIVPTPIDSHPRLRKEIR